MPNRQKSHCYLKNISPIVVLLLLHCAVEVIITGYIVVTWW